MARTRYKPDWSGLPSGIFYSIAKFLPTRIDILRFRAVCHDIRSAVPLPPKPLSPYLALKIPLPGGLGSGVRGHFLLTQSTEYAVEPLFKIRKTRKAIGTWLVRVEERNSGKVVAKSVFSEDKCRKRKWLKSLNLLDYRIREISKVYDLEFVPDFDIQGRSVPFETFTEVVFSSGLDEIDEDFSLMAILESKLLLWRYGDKEWTAVSRARNFNLARYEQIVYNNGKFVALSTDSVAMVVDPKALVVAEFFTPRLGSSRRLLKTDQAFLLKSDEHLFLILKCVAGMLSKTSDDGRINMIRLYICELDEEKNEWVELTDRLPSFWPSYHDHDRALLLDGLDDRVLFRNFGSTFSLVAKGFVGLRRNCVYIMGYSIDDVSPEASTVVKDRIAQQHVFPANSAVSWPPPAWLSRDSRSTHP